MFEKTITVDGRGHLLGRLASIVAKELLGGQRVVVVRCEQLNISGHLHRNKIKFENFLRKRTATNPKRGPIHFHAPSKIFWRTVRGMIPHKTARGKAAMARLKVFDGMPHPYDKVKKMVLPEALRILRLRPNRAFTVLGDLASRCGWQYAEVVDTLEAKRKVKAAAFYEKKKAAARLNAKAVAAADLSSVAATLEQYGH